jgi:hypothetical protein
MLGKIYSTNNRLVKFIFVELVSIVNNLVNYIKIYISKIVFINTKKTKMFKISCQDNFERD